MYRDNDESQRNVAFRVWWITQYGRHGGWLCRIIIRGPSIVVIFMKLDLGYQSASIGCFEDSDNDICKSVSG